MFFSAGMARIPMEHISLNVLIPVQPVSYDDAHDLMLYVFFHIEIYSLLKRLLWCH